RGINVADGQFLKDSSAKPLMFLASDLTAIGNNSHLRKAIKTTLDLFAIGNPAPKMRRDAIIKLGQEQNAEYLSHFQKRLEVEKNPEVIKALVEATALTRTKDADAAVRNAAIIKLGEMHSINALEFLKELRKDVEKNPARYGTQTPEALR